MLSGFAVHLGFQPITQAFVFGQRRPARSRRGHQSGSKLTDHAFPQFGVVADGGQIQLLKRQVRRFGVGRRR